MFPKRHEFIRQFANISLTIGHGRDLQRRNAAYSSLRLRTSKMPNFK